MSVLQHGKLCARGIALLSSEEPDIIRHEATMPEVDGPDESLLYRRCAGPDAPSPAAAMRIVGNFHPGEPSLVRDPVLRHWACGPGLDGNLTKSQAFVAFVSAGPNISMAMLPHEGFGTMMAHQSVSTGIMTHSVTFHEPMDARECCCSTM